MRRFKEYMRRPLALLLTGCLLIGVLLLLSSMFSNDDSIEGPPLQVQRVEDPEHAADDYIVTVPEERIPQSMDERLVASPVALLPNHTGFPEARGEVNLPQAERARLGRALEDALSEWETFLPSDGFRDRYRKRMESLSLSETLDAIVERRDANDAPGVCPEESCRLGSRWFRPGAISWFVIDSSVDRVYIVAYSAVVYRGDPDSDSRVGSSSERAYGVIMRRSGDDWLLERVAAESLR